MAAFRKFALAGSAASPSSATGNGTTVEVDRAQDHSENAQLSAQFIVDTAGATPTITWKLQGSHDGTNWYDWNYVTDATDTAATTALTSTATGAKVIFLANPGARMYRYNRIVTSSNTNITYHAELYAYAA